MLIYTGHTHVCIRHLNAFSILLFYKKDSLTVACVLSKHLLDLPTYHKIEMAVFFLAILDLCLHLSSKGADFRFPELIMGST